MEQVVAEQAGDYRLTYADYCHAQWLYLRHRPRAIAVYACAYWLIPAAVLAMLGYLLWLGLARHVALGWDTWGWAIFATAAESLVVAARPLTLRRAYRQLFGKAPVQPEGVACRFRFDAEQFHSEQPGISEGRIRWAALLDYLEDAQVALLFLHRKRFLIVPLRALPGDAWVELGKLARVGVASQPAQGTSVL